MKFKAVAVMLLLMLFPSSAQSLKLGIAVGIDDYQGFGDLNFARADAIAVSSTLDSLGYSVDPILDVSAVDFFQYLDAVTNNLNSEDTFVFFFSGHGVNENGANSIIFSDFTQVPVENILRRIKASGVNTTIMILDACRSYPDEFPTTRSLSTKSFGSFSSEVPGGRGTFIIYSAGAGQFAYEGVGNDPNSLFTRELIKLMPEPNLSIRSLSVELRNNVEQIASEFGIRQTPAYYDEIVGEFSFASGVLVSSSGSQDTPHLANGAEISTDCQNETSSFASIVTSSVYDQGC